MIGLQGASPLRLVAQQPFARCHPVSERGVKAAQENLDCDDGASGEAVILGWMLGIDVDYPREAFKTCLSYADVAGGGGVIRTGRDQTQLCGRGKDGRLHLGLLWDCILRCKTAQ